MTYGIHHENLKDMNRVHRFTRQAMATEFGILCVHEDQRYAEQAAAAAFDLVEKLERDLTSFRDSSDISRINHLRPGNTATVSHWTMECLLLAKHFYDETGGAFDVSLGSGFEAVDLQPDGFSVRIHSDCVRLNLGGIGKGYALDRARELLEEWDIRQALLHGGYSSVLALEAPPGREGWSLTISVPGADPPQVLERITARRQAWSASGIRKADHIVDPRTGKAVQHRAAAWVSGRLEELSVLCRTGGCSNGLPGPRGDADAGNSPSAIAEALSTAFMTLSVEEIEVYCREHAGVKAWILDSAPAAPADLKRFPS